MQQLLNKKYRIVQLLNQTTDCRVEVITTANQEFVAKSMELNKSDRLKKEIANYKRFQKANLHGCSHLVDTFKTKDRLYLVMPRFGRNLQQLKQLCGGRFSLKTSLMLAIQMLDRIRYVHSQGLIHGDIKPQNYLIGLKKLKHKIFMIDFELSQPYIVDGQHIQIKKKEHIDGTLRFLSLSANRGYPISRKDELQSLIYCLIYFMKGDLPWVNLVCHNFIEAYDRIRKMKEYDQQIICEGCPQQIIDLLVWVRKLKFDQEPDYTHIQNVLFNLFKKNGYELDYFYDWQFI